VVRVDLEVAATLDRQAETTVSSKLVEHVVKERDSGRGGDCPAIEVDIDLHRRFARRALT